VSDVEYERRFEGDKKRIVATFDLRFAVSLSIPQLMEAVETVPDVRRVLVQHKV
jgi:hypothetical protein